MKTANHNSSFSRVFTALKWNYAGSGVRVLSQFTIGIILARLLGPEPLGVVAGAWIVIGLGNLVSDGGFSVALIQKQRLTDLDVRYAFTMQLLVGATMMAIVAILAPLAGRLLELPALTPVLRILCSIFLLQSIGLTGAALLRRRLDFKALQQAQVLSYIVAYLLLGIPLALFGFGIWSIVSAQLLQTALYSALLYNLTRHSLRPLFRTEDRALGRFGALVLGTNLVNWSLTNVDSAAVGRSFGVVELGLYNRAFTLMMMPVMAIVAVIQSVLFSAVASSQQSISRLREMYLASLRVICLLMLPFYLGVAAVPGTVIEGLYGSLWRSAAPVIPPLAIAFALYSLVAPAGPVLQGMGKVGREFQLQLLTAAVLIGALAAGGRTSLVVIAWSVSGAYLVRFTLMTSAVLRLVEATWSDVVKAVRPALGLSVIIALSLAAVAHLTAWLPPSGRLLLVIFFGAIEVLLIVAFRPHYFLDQRLLERLSVNAGPIRPITSWLASRSLDLSDVRP